MCNEILTSDDKEYIATVKLGILTDTLDMDGKILKEEKVCITKEKLINALNSFEGSYEQEVPIYSAVKINGRKLYEYARNDEQIKLPRRNVKIKSIELLELDDVEYKFKVSVSKGTYIRSLINDMSKSIKIPMCMSNLKRTKQDKFSIEDSYTIKDIRKGNYKLLDIEDIIDLNIIDVSDSLYDIVKNGGLIEKTGDKPILFRKDGKNIALYMDYDKNKNLMKPFIFYGGN